MIKPYMYIPTIKTLTMELILANPAPENRSGFLFVLNIPMIPVIAAAIQLSKEKENKR
jgi:hypothetical protein